MEIKPGDRVTHLKAPEWGIGEVLPEADTEEFTCTS